MKLKLESTILLIFLSIIFFSCEKEYSLEEGLAGGTAVYTMTGSPGSCTNAVVTGIYEVGVALGNTNIVTISVEVVNVGTYAVSTATDNGISFSGSGAFADTGTQIITLIGTGTPVSSGIYSFTPGTYGCSFPVTISGGGGIGGTSVFTLAGAPGNCTSFTPEGTYVAGTTLGAGNFVTVGVDVTALGTYTITTNSVNGISFSGSGTFATTGIQDVQLSGSGTPLAGGTFAFSPGATGCTFSITVTGSGSGSAVFTYDGSPGSCTNPTPAGAYVAGDALTVSNTVMIGVNVTTIGTYAISTALVNGFSFAGNGNFTATGPQVVALTGTGTPVAEGITNFTPANNGCEFSITVLPSGGASVIFYEATIDGVYYTATVTDINGYEAGSSVGGVDDVVLSSNISPITQPIPLNQTEMAISKGILHNYLTASFATFKSFFDPGTYPWSASGSDGVSVSWTDPTGNFWASDNSPGTQTGSVFTIVSVIDEPGTTDYIRVTATFNCTLYDLTGNAKTLTGGKYVGLFGKL